MVDTYLPYVDVLLRQTRLSESFRDSRGRGYTHIAGLHAHERAGDILADDVPALLLRPRARGEDAQSGSVTDAARVSRGRRAVLEERRLELCKRLERDAWSDSVIY